MNKRIKRAISIITATVMLVTSFATVLANAEVLKPTAYAEGDVIGRKKYTVTSPYDRVNWDLWNAYKSASHVHTCMSDGVEEYDEMIEEYYKLGYDCLSITDHGTVDRGWTDQDKGDDRLAIFKFWYLLHGKIDPLTEKRYQEITTGADRNGRGMTEVPMGIEINAASTSLVHVNSYFADCGQGVLDINASWPGDAVEMSANAGGISHLNHIGYWTDGQEDRNVYNDDKLIERFVNLYNKYPSCVGMELVNFDDAITLNDRYLYDKIMQKLAPEGKMIYGFCEDDSHRFSECGLNANYYMMPENTASSIRNCMQTGAFFACSVNAVHELGKDFKAEGNFPMVKRIYSDSQKNQITITASDAEKLCIVSNGTEIDTVEIGVNGKATIDLNNYENCLGSYLRMYLTGKGGVCFTQPFLISAEDCNISTTQFNLPASDCVLIVKDSNGKIIQPVNNAQCYTLDEGTYTYYATREGYKPIVDEEFKIEKTDVRKGMQIVIDVKMEFDTTNISTAFYVPEVIYLDSVNRDTFEFYLDRENDVDGILSQSPDKRTGNVFFSCNKAKSVVISIDENVLSATDGTGNFSNGYKFNSSTVATSIKSGKLQRPLSQGTGKLVRWIATCTLENGKTFDSYAFSYVYSPGSFASAAGMRHVHTEDDDVYNQGVLWITGVNSVYGGTHNCIKNFLVDTAPNSNSGIANWFEVYGGGGVGFGNYTHSSDNSDSHTVNGGTGVIYVDSSRFTNLEQIPNLRNGYWQCDVEGNDVATGYINYSINGNTTNIKNFYSGPASVLDRPIKIENVRNVNTTRTMTLNAYSYTGISNRKNHNYYSTSLEARYNSKACLRDVYSKAVRMSVNAGDYTAISKNNYTRALAVVGELICKIDSNPDYFYAAAMYMESVLESLTNNKNNDVSISFVDGMQRINEVQYTESDTDSATDTNYATDTDSSEQGYRYGDVNDDGKINMNDVTDYQCLIAGLTDFSSFSDNSQPQADVNLDGLRNLEDVVLIQRHIAGLIIIKEYQAQIRY